MTDATDGASKKLDRVDATQPSMSGTEGATSLGEIAWLFLRLGTISFGGPAAHIALMHDEVVRRRGWLTESRFLDLMGVASLIPGPNSTEMAIFVGWERRRWQGLIVSGCAFIVPAMLLTALLGHFYARFHHLPFVSHFLYGVKPVMLAIVLQAVWGLLPKAAHSRRLVAVGAVALLGAALGVDEIGLLLGMGVLSFTLAHASTSRASSAPLRGLVLAVPVAGTSVLATKVSVSGLFLTFLKIGTFLFGSGYVLLAFLRTELVQKLGWLTESQLMDAIAVGQVTPGPVFTTATFVGYLLAGPSGALAATLGIFLPAFFFVAVCGPILNRLRSSSGAAAVIEGVNVASLALMLVVALRLARTAVVDWAALLISCVSLLLLLRWKLNATWLIVGGAVVGWLLGGAPGPRFVY
jgi:chromate transporter